MAKKANDHEFGTMNTEQNEYAWGVFMKFWKYTLVISAIIAIFFMYLAGK